MAASQLDLPLPGASFFDLHHDGTTTRSPVSLPDGGCNFVDLTPGANGAKCGCRRFWSRTVSGRGFADTVGSDHTAWCMCTHHACYHDHTRDAEAATPVIGFVPGQENTKPKGHREPLSPVVQDASFRLPSGFSTSLDLMNLDAAMLLPMSKPEDARNPCAGTPSQQLESTLQDTLSWGEFVQSQSANTTTLPPIPPQCLMPSQPSSTTSSSQARYLRPFAGKGLNTLSGVHQPDPRSLRQEKPQDLEPMDIQPTRSGMEVVTAGAASAVGNGSDTPKARRSPVLTVQAPAAIFGSPSRDTFRHMSDTVQGHEQRLDRLENVSFSAGGNDECHEKHDAMDLRVTDLEGRVEEVEKLMNDNTSHGTARHLRQPAVDESMSSAVSVSTSATARISDASEVYNHIQSLQSQLRHLQSFVPSCMHAWEVEVVFLPFALRRIWQERHDFKLEPTSSMDEWTQLPNTNSTARSGTQSPYHGDWAASRRDYDWLLAKACGAQSLIDRRLRSRGLVKTMSVKGPDARSVEAAIQAAFGPILHRMSTSASTSRRRSINTKMDKFMGLQQPWVPLRKIHKDSRLRFLSPAEMVTPALWDVPFLNSIIMRASERRLFITQSEAYLQDLHMHDQGWTWQRLREQPRVYPEKSASQDVPEADAHEECWAFTEQLDEPVSAQSSLGMRELATAQRASTSPSQRYFHIDPSLRSPSPYVTRGQTPRHEAHVTRPIHARTTSMPPAGSALISPSGIKRRVASSGQQRKGSVTPQMQARLEVVAVAYKRQRTGSPSRPHHTPRWTSSPSPALAMFPTEHERVQPARGVTPLYYATPFSNAPLTESRMRGSGGMPDEDSDEHGEADSGSTNLNDDESIYRAATGARFTIAEDSDVQHLRQLQPEDEPWPGIEDQDRISDGENIDPLFSQTADDATSVASSQPSEYPSTQRGWGAQGADDDDDMGFRIHEDDDRMM